MRLALEAGEADRAVSIAEGLHPERNPFPRYNAVAAMRDLTNHLYFGSVKETQHTAGDEDDE